MLTFIYHSEKRGEKGIDVPLGSIELGRSPLPGMFRKLGPNITLINADIYLSFGEKRRRRNIDVPPWLKQ